MSVFGRPITFEGPNAWPLEGHIFPPVSPGTEYPVGLVLVVERLAFGVEVFYSRDLGGFGVTRLYLGKWVFAAHWGPAKAEPRP